MPVVSIYLVTREYGGPEEGGWWYDHGTPEDEFIRYMRVYKSEYQAQVYRDRLERHVVRHLNRGRRHYTSVLGEGEFRAVITDGIPREFPEQHPYYE